MISIDPKFLAGIQPAPPSLPTALMPKGCTPTHPVTYEEATPYFAPAPFTKPNIPALSLVNLFYEEEVAQRKAITNHRIGIASRNQARDKTLKKRYDLSNELALPEAPLPGWLRSATLLSSSWGLVKGTQMLATGATPLGALTAGMSLLSLASAARSESRQSGSKFIGTLALGASAIAAGLGLPIQAGNSIATEAITTFFNATSGIGIIKQASFGQKRKQAEGEAMLLDARLDKQTSELSKAQSYNLKHIASSEKAALTSVLNWVKDKEEIQKGLWQAMNA